MFMKKESKDVVDDSDDAKHSVPTNQDTNQGEDFVMIDPCDLVECDHGDTSISLQNNDLGEIFECYVPSVQLTSTFLVRQFNSLYIEGKSFPRRFLLLTNYNIYGTKLLVTHISDSPCCNHSFVSIRVVPTVKTNTLKHRGIVDLRELCWHFAMGRQKAFVPRKLFQLEHVRQARVADIHYIWKCLLNEPPSTTMIAREGCNDFVDVCPLCSTCIEKCTYLVACNHKVCDSCWVDYLKTEIIAAVHIECPMFGCNEKLDLVTLFCFAENNLLVSYILKLVADYTLYSKKIKRCPSIKCQSFALSNYTLSEEKKGFSPDIPIVLCDCTLNWCFECQQTEHWPASCTANHALEVLRKSEIGLLYAAKGFSYELSETFRPCPRCHVLIEHGEGCDQMTCVCGGTFCWCCLGSWNDCRLRTTTSAKLKVFSNRGSRAEKIQRRAIHFKIIAEEMMSNHKETKHNIPLALIYQSYQVLANLSAALAVCEARNSRRAYIRNISAVEGRLLKLKTALDKNETWGIILKS